MRWSGVRLMRALVTCTLRVALQERPPPFGAGSQIPVPELLFLRLLMIFGLAMTTWPASGDWVTPSDSYFGQVGIIPTRPSVRFVIGHASSWVTGSMVPAKALDTGWLNMS